MKTILKFWVGGFSIACGISCASSIVRGGGFAEYLGSMLFAGISIGWGMFTTHEAMKDNK